MLMRILAMVCAVLLATPVYAGSKIDLVQSDGSIVPQGGQSDAAKVSQATLLSGEDQTNNLLNMSGGAVRGSEGNIINAAVGNATSAAFTLPSGTKLITGRITGAGAVAQVITIYGGTSVGMVTATSEVVCTLSLTGTSGGSGTALSCTAFTTPYLFYIAVTSGSSGTPTTILTASY